MLTLEECVKKVNEEWKRQAISKNKDYVLSDYCNEYSTETNTIVFWVDWIGPRNHPEWSEVDTLLNGPLDVNDCYAIDKESGDIRCLSSLYTDYSRSSGKRINISKFLS